MATGVLRGRDVESFLSIDLTGSTGRTLTAVEFVARTIRFTGTLGQSITIRLPLSVTEDVGRTYTFENQCSGGFTITIAAISGAGVDVAPGAAITAFWDGVRMTGQAASAATGIAGVAGGISTLYPITILDPQIGDAVTFLGPGGFGNTPAPSLTDAVILAPATSARNVVLPTAAAVVPATLKASDALTTAPAVSLVLGHTSSGTPGVGYGTELRFQAKDTTTADVDAGSVQVLWATAAHATRKGRFIEGVYDTAFREGLRHDTSGSAARTTFGDGSLTGTARLHVRDDVNAELAIFEGQNLFSSVFFKLGDDSQQAAVRIYPGIAASGGNTLVESGGLILRGHYWSGAASVPSDAWWRVSMAATTPTFYLVAGVGAAEKLWLRNNGQIYIGLSAPSADTEAVVIGNNATGSSARLKGHVAIDDGVDFIPQNGAGVRWGTGSTAKMGWWGNTARARGAVSGATTEALLDNSLTLLASYGLIEPFVSPLSVVPWLFIDPRNFTGAHNDPVGTLTDTSGFARSPTAAGSLRGTLQVSSNLSPNGSRLVRLDGVDDSYDFTTTMFAVTSGVMITIAGNFSTNAGAGQVIFTDNTGQRPQCIVETFTTNLYAFRDEGHTATFGGFSGGWQVLQWVFRPPSGGTGVAELWKNGALLGTSTWNWNPGSSSGFLVSGGPLSAKVDLGPVIVTPGDVSDLSRIGLKAWCDAHYGAP